MAGADNKAAEQQVEPHGLDQSASFESQPVDTKNVAGTTLISAGVRETITPLTMLALCFNICSSWAGLATSLQIALLQGGPMTLIYGIFVTTFIYLCISLILAELASVYPTAGGQYHFTSILAPEGVNRLLSYICGWVTAFCWIATGAACLTITSYQLAAVVTFYDEPMLSHPWQVFLVYQALSVSCLLYNIFLIKRWPATHTFGFVLSLAMFITIFVGLLARSRPKATSVFVWDSFINYTGWPDGVCFMTGLLTPFFMYGGIDGSLHLAEEADNPRKVVPRVAVGVVIVGFVTAFPFAVAVLYSLSDFEAIITSDGWVPFEVFRQGFRSDTAAVFLTCAGVVLGFIIINAVYQAGSRVIWSYARDQGFAFSGALSRIHSRLDVPVLSLLLMWSLVAVSGFLILASSVAINAIIGSTVVHQLLSMFIPFVLLLYRRRSEEFLPSNRQFKVPGLLGWAVNVFAACIIPVLIVFFCLPPFLPATGTTMNYTVVVLGVVTILGILNWVFYARRHYQGPRMEWQL